MEISLPSFGSSQTFPLPHFRTLAASRFWSLRETISASSSRAAVGERIRPGRVYVVFIPWDFLPLGFRGTCVIGAMGLWALKDDGSLESVSAIICFIYIYIYIYIY